MKKIILRLSNGLGNQMFMYASAFAISKKLNRVLEYDSVSSFKKINKNKYRHPHHIPYFALYIFNLSAKKTNKDKLFDNFLSNLKRKLLIKLNNFKKKKNFIIEERDINKLTKYKNNFDNLNLDDIVFLEGHFESEKYFKKYRKELLKEFSLKKKINCVRKYEEDILSSNSVSMVIRADRYNELKDTDNYLSQSKSIDFEKKQIDYINRSVEYFKQNTKNPKFFIFSDNSKKIKKLFNFTENFIFIENFINNKVEEDYYLMTLCKHFAVSPSSFHFWPAWLSESKNKICLKPKNLKTSNNLDYWPESWIEV